MKVLIKLVFIIFILSSCKSKNSILPDYSKNAYEPILLIKKQVEKTKCKFNVEIISRHNEIYILNSKIEVENDSVKIESYTRNNSYLTQSDTILNFSKIDILEILEIELQKSDHQIILAGNYQDIKISTADSTNLFYTRQSWGIINILEKGKSNFIK